MKALHFLQHGGIANLLYGEVKPPVPSSDEVLIKVGACSLNHLDLWVLEGWPGLKLEMPHVGGADIAGEIVEVPPAVFGWRTGDRVVVCPGYATAEDEFTQRGEESVSPSYRVMGEGRRGGFAEYVTVPARSLLGLPSGIEYTDAAAPLLVGLTAWRMLKHRSNLQKGDTILIVGAGGGLNSFCIQLAQFLGAEVIALTRGDFKATRARALGAAHVIDYARYTDWSRKVREITNGRGVDVVIDNVGAKTFEQSIRAVRRGGSIVTVGNTSGPIVTFDNRLIFTKQISLIGSTMGSSEDFREVMQVVWDHRVKTSIDSVMPLSDGAEAYRKLEKGEQFGKIVLTP